MTTTFIDKKKLAAETFAVTPARLIKFYLMNAILARAQQAEEARAKSGGKSASGRYIPFVGPVEFSFKTSVGMTLVKKSSRYMAGRLNELRPVEQTREVCFTPDAGGGLMYSFFVELKDENGRESSSMLSTKEVKPLFHVKDHNKINVEVLDEVAADMFSFLYSQRPEEAAMKKLRLQEAA